jgi:MFS family permease
LILYFLGAMTFVPKSKSSSQQATGSDASAHMAAKPQPQSFKSYTAGLKELMKTPGLFMLIMSSSFRSMTQGTLLTFLPLYLAKEMQYNVFWVGAVMAILQVAGCVAAPIAGHMSDQWGRRTLLMSCFAVTGVVLLLMTFAGGSSLFVVLIALLGFFLYAARPVMQAWLLESTPKNMGGTSIGLMFGMQSGAQAVAPILGGIVADHYGLMAAFYFLAGTIVLANLMIFFTPAPANDPQAKA